MLKKKKVSPDIFAIIYFTWRGVSSDLPQNVGCKLSVKLMTIRKTV